MPAAAGHRYGYGHGHGSAAAPRAGRLPMRRLLAAAFVIAALLGLALAGGAGNNGNGPGLRPGAAAAQTTHSGWGTANWNYDNDDDNLIDIWNLAQLNAVRWDLNGNGNKESSQTQADWDEYKAAFLNATPNMGCPATCTGYELRADLDFDTDDDGSTHTNGSGDSGDAYYNGNNGWDPIGGAYSATFQGNGHTIDNLFIRKTNSATNIGLFRELSGSASINTLGVRYAYVTDAHPGQLINSGILVGRSGGAIAAAYTTGAMRGEEFIGGIVGQMVGGSIQASYSTATVWSQNEVGGLVGQMGGGSITGSYYAGPSVTSGTNSSARGGLVGQRTGGTITDTYWDDSPTGVPTTSAGSSNSDGKTTAELQNPTGYIGIYANWNLNLDGQTGGDDPWHFGYRNEYPALQYGGHNHLDQHHAAIDYDDDSDNLIEIRTLAQLDAVRYDLNGNGNRDSESAANWARYRAAFPRALDRMGCAATCAGYELRANLDFDTDGDGYTHTNGIGDAGDDYYTTTTGTGQGWNPLGGHASGNPQFTATFDGNSHTISNLYINLDTAAAAQGIAVGLFHASSSSGSIRNLGLVNPYVKNTRRAKSFSRTGALVGYSTGTVSRAWVAGGQVIANQAYVGTVEQTYAGCLIGQQTNSGSVADSYATCDITATGGNSASPAA